MKNLNLKKIRAIIFLLPIWLYLLLLIIELTYLLVYDEDLSSSIKIILTVVSWSLCFPLICYSEYMTYKYYEDSQFKYFPAWILRKTNNVVLLLFADIIMYCVLVVSYIVYCIGFAETFKQIFIF